MKKIAAVGAAALCLGVPATASADDTARYRNVTPFAENVENRCTGEIVAVRGEPVVDLESREEDGELRFRARERTTGSGVSQSGVLFDFDGRSESEHIVSTGRTSQSSYLSETRLDAQGDGPLARDFTLRSRVVVVIHPDGRVEVVREDNETICE